MIHLLLTSAERYHRRARCGLEWDVRDKGRNPQASTNVRFVTCPACGGRSEKRETVKA